MRYRNGRIAKNGDKVVHISGYGSAAEVVALGVMFGIVPGNNGGHHGGIAPIHTAVTSACLSDCLHVQDVAAILKECGLDTRQVVDAVAIFKEGSRDTRPPSLL